MKVNQTYIKTQEVNVGDEFVVKEKDKGIFKVTQIDVNENATFISIVDESGNDTTYGSKTFMSKYEYA